MSQNTLRLSTAAVYSAVPYPDDLRDDSRFAWFFKKTKDLFLGNLELLRGGNKKAFTRSRKVTPEVLFDMGIGYQNRPAVSEIFAYCDACLKSPGEELSSKDERFSKQALRQARLKANPNAWREAASQASFGFLAEHIYEAKTFCGMIPAPIDGTDFVVTDSEECEKLFGRSTKGDKNTPCMAKGSVLYLPLNRFMLDMRVQSYKYSERELAARHFREFLRWKCCQPIDIRKKKFLFIFDRGYFSYSLMHHIYNKDERFIFKLKEMVLSEYSEQIGPGEDCSFLLELNTADTQMYRSYKAMRQQLLSSKYNLRIVKHPTEFYDNGVPKKWEILLTNITEEEMTSEQVGEAYHLRWGSETDYDWLKNYLEMEQFSSGNPILILQEVYAAWMRFNLGSLLTADAECQFPKFMKPNTNCNFSFALGQMVTHAYRLIEVAGDMTSAFFLEILKRIAGERVDVRPGRHFERKFGKSLNKRRSHKRPHY